MNIRHNLIFKSCLLIFGIIFSVFFTVLKINEVQAVAACSQWYGPDMYLTITDQNSGQVYGSYSVQDDNGDGDTLYNGSITVPYGAVLRFESRSVMPFNYGNGAHNITIIFPYNRNDNYSGVALSQTRTNYSDAMDNGNSFYAFVSSSGCDTGSESYVSVGDMNITINVQAPPTPTPIYGCMDPAASNYNKSATVAGSCTYDGDIIVVSKDSSGNPISAPSWTITGQANYSGSGTSGAYLNAPVGTYSITAGGISGYSGPVINPSTQGLNANSSITFTLTYTANSGPPPPPPPPPPPGSGSPPGAFTLSVAPCRVVNGSRTVSLSWTVSSGTGISYEIYEKQGSGVWNKLTTISGTSYDVSGRPPNTALYYYIKAVNSDGSTNSNPGGGVYGGNCPSTPPPPGACSVDTFTADNVTNLSLPYPNSGATLGWRTTDAITLVGSGAWSGNKTIREGSQSTGALAVGTYTYVLSCTASGGNNSKSVTINVSEPPDPPPNKVTVLSSCENISINWNFSADPVAPGYYIDISTNSQFNGRWTKHIPNPTKQGFDNFNGTSEATNVGNGWYNNPDSPSSVSGTLTPGQTYYARVWSNFTFYPNPQGSVSFITTSCPTPTPKPTQPTWSGQPACVVPTGVYNANISWTGVHNTTDETVLGGFGTYIDVDEDENEVPIWKDGALYDWWNRNIPKNDSTRTVNTGGSSFRGLWPDQTNILNGLRPGVTYYARAYNGYPQWGVHSDDSAPLTVPACTLAGTLTANPTTGTGPLSVTLTATRASSSTTSGLITYEFDCRSNDTYVGTVTTSSTTATFSCSYPADETSYYAKVIITQSDALGQNMSYEPPPVEITSNFVCGDLEQSCTSQPNVCGQTNTGTQTRTCDPNTGVDSDWSACSAVPPPNSSCPASGPSVSCNPSTVNYNASSTVSWACTNSTSSVVSGNSGNWYGTCTEDGDCEGSQSTGALTSNQTYTVTCTGFNGSNTTASCPVTVSAPTLTISPPQQLPYGSKPTITWTVTNAGSCTATNGTTGWPGSKNATTGTHSWTSPVGITTPGWYFYTLECEGNGKTGPKNAQVEILPPVPNPPTNVTVKEPDYCSSGPIVTVSWTYSDPANSPQKGYQVQIDDQGSYNSINIDSCPGGPPNGTCSPGGSSSSSKEWNSSGQGVLDFNTVYHARVRYWNDYGVASNWQNATMCVGPGCTGSDSWKTPNYAYPNVIPPYQFTWPTPPKPQLNKPVQFADHTVFGGGNSNNRSWSWSFGDGGTSTQQSPAHTYTTVGNYTVTEKVYDNVIQNDPIHPDGYCSYSQSVEVLKPIPVIKEVAPK